MKKLLLIITLVILFSEKYSAQQLQSYCDFDGSKFVFFGYHTGILDTMFSNPDPNTINNSWYCGRYVRDTAQYDNFQIFPKTDMRDISDFESSSMNAPKIQMKVYSTAPVNSVIQLQLGSSTIESYPAGIRSEYIAYTSVKDAWQNLTFYFLQMTPGGLASSTGIDKMVILFRPETNGNDTLYFDNLVGPALSPVGIPTAEMQPFKIFQNSPNPAKDNTHINFILNSAGEVSLKLFDMLGNPLYSLVEQNLKAGSYSIPVDTEKIPNGIYFYVLKKDGVSRSMKMIVSK